MHSNDSLAQVDLEIFIRLGHFYSGKFRHVQACRYLNNEGGENTSKPNFLKLNLNTNCVIVYIFF